MTDFLDPFASAPENDIPKESSTVEESTNEPIRVTEDAGAFTATLKASRDFNAPWMVIRASSPEDFMKKAQEFVSSGAMEVLVKTAQRFADEFSKGNPTQGTDQARNGAQNGFESRPQPRSLPPGIPEIRCSHGIRNYVSRGNWAALFCAAPKGTPDHEKCEPFWRQKDGSFQPRSR